MSAATWLDPLIPLTITADGTWQDVDVSAHVVNASGVMLLLNPTATAQPVKFRKKGSTDEYLGSQTVNTGNYLEVFIGIDGNNVFQANLGSTFTGTVYLKGYFNKDDVVFFDNAIVSPQIDGSWQTWDIKQYTGTDDPQAVVCYLSNDSGNARQLELRAPGSLDSFFARTNGNVLGTSSVGTCVNGDVQYYVSSSIAYIYAIGYIKSGYTPYSTAVNVSISSIGAWQTLPNTPVQFEGAFFTIRQVSNQGDRDLQLRPGASLNFDSIEKTPSIDYTTLSSGADNDIVQGYRTHVNSNLRMTGSIDKTAAQVAAPNPLLLGQDF